MSALPSRLAAGLLFAGLFAAPALAADHAVTISNFKFQPASLTVAVGDTVTFTNKDGAPHTATADNGGFDTGQIPPGGSKSVTVDAAGKHPYHCDFHPNMKGAVTAQ